MWRSSRSTRTDTRISRWGSLARSASTSVRGSRICGIAGCTAPLHGRSACAASAAGAHSRRGSQHARAGDSRGRSPRFGARAILDTAHRPALEIFVPFAESRRRCGGIPRLRIQSSLPVRSLPDMKVVLASLPDGSAGPASAATAGQPLSAAAKSPGGNGRFATSSASAHVRPSVCNTVAAARSGSHPSSPTGFRAAPAAA